MFCVKCGKEIPDHVQFCTYCGNQVKMMPASAVSQGTEAEDAKKTNTGGLLIAGCIIAVCLLLGGIGFAGFRFLSKKADTTVVQSNEDREETENEETDDAGTNEESADASEEETQTEVGGTGGSKQEEQPEEVGEETIMERVQKLNASRNAIPSIDVDAPNYEPAQRDINAAWDQTLFYTLEDIDKESMADGLINTYLISRKELLNADSGNQMEYDIYTDPGTNKVHKIVSIEYVGEWLNITEYYYTAEGKVNFIYVYADTNYFPSYATPNRDGNRYYFNGDVMTKWRVVLNGGQTNYVLGENSAAVGTNAGNVILMKDFSQEEQETYDRKEREMLNMAYNTYNTVLNTDGVAMIQGYVYGEDSDVISGVYVALYEEGNPECLYETQTDEQGLYSIYVPTDVNEYRLAFKEANCDDVEMYSIRMNNQTLGGYQPSVYMIPTAGSDISVQIDDALNYNEYGDGMAVVAGADYAIRRGVDNFYGEVVASGVTDSYGYIYEYLPTGMYTVEISKAGYDQSYFTLTVRTSNNTVQFHLSPKLAEGEMRIVLTWNDYPNDLDSHLFTPYCTAEEHICYYHREDEKGNSLDVDITSGYGPETVTVANLERNGLYKYYVADYTNCSQEYYDSYAMSFSNASVHVYTHDGLVAEFNVPTNKEGVIWEVFEIRNGVIIPAQRYYKAVEDNDWWSMKW